MIDRADLAFGRGEALDDVIDDEQRRGTHAFLSAFETDAVMAGV